MTAPRHITSRKSQQLQSLLLPQGSPLPAVFCRAAPASYVPRVFTSQPLPTIPFHNAYRNKEMQAVESKARALMSPTDRMGRVQCWPQSTTLASTATSRPMKAWGPLATLQFCQYRHAVCLNPILTLTDWKFILCYHISKIHMPWHIFQLQELL